MKNLKDSIYKNFMTKGIFDHNKIKKYIAFCIDNKNDDNNQYSEEHHILPKGIFKEYENLRKNNWNLAKLTYTNHIKAHILLIKSILTDTPFGKDIAFRYRYSLVRMTNRNFDELNELSPKDFELIELNRINYINELKENWHNIFDSDSINSRGKVKSENAKKTSRKFNLFHIKKGLIMENVQYKDIRSICKNLNNKENYTYKKPNSYDYIHLQGFYVEEVSSKSVPPYLKHNELRQIAYDINKDNKIKVYSLRNINGKPPLNIEKVTQKDIRQMTGNSKICQYTKEHYLGGSKCAATKLMNNNKEQWIGAYVIEELISIEEFYKIKKQEI